MHKDTLILGAFEPEVKLLRDSFKVDAVGIGAIEAAVNTTRILSSGDYKEVLFVGSVGSFDRELPLLETFVSATDVVYLDYAEAMEFGQVPDGQVRRIVRGDPDVLHLRCTPRDDNAGGSPRSAFSMPSLGMTVGGYCHPEEGVADSRRRDPLAQSHTLLQETVLTTPSLSYDNKVVEAIYGKKGVNARFENLELFGVASACEALGVSWGSLCCLTNYLGPDGHGQWKGNYLEAAERTAQLLLSLD